MKFVVYKDDVIEKTDADAAVLRARFGLPVATLVFAVSEDERIIGYGERKAALREQVARAGHEALMVFAADKISKVRALRLENVRTRQPAACVSVSRDRRLAPYRRCLRLLEQLLTDSPLVKQCGRSSRQPPRGGLRLQRRVPGTASPEVSCDAIRERAATTLAVELPGRSELLGCGRLELRALIERSAVRALTYRCSRKALTAL